MTTNAMECRLCGGTLSHAIPGDRQQFVTCPTCGEFGYGTLFWTDAVLRLEDKHLLSGVLREASEKGQPLTVGMNNWEDLLKLAPHASDVATRADKLLRAIARRSKHPGDRVLLGPFDFALAYARNSAELRYYADCLRDGGLLKSEGHSSGITAIVTPAGWAALRQPSRSESRKAFVAMSFSPNLRYAYDEGIRPAVEDDCGYDAIRVDDEEHNERIDELIVAEIRESRFVVADFTEHKNGVYFEAGFGMGLGLPVVWLCHEGHRKDRHFDTRQFNHIFWKDAADLRERLALRVRATIGFGPNKRFAEHPAP